MNSNQYFKRNRYNSDIFINELSKNKVLDDTLFFNIDDEEIEVYLDEQVKNREYIKEVLNNIEYIDNYVQSYCEENFIKGNYNFKIYAVALSWIDIKKDKVTIRYWGEYVNVELETIFIKVDNEWIVKDIYYC